MSKPRRFRDMGLTAIDVWVQVCSRNKETRFEEFDRLLQRAVRLLPLWRQWGLRDLTERAEAAERGRQEARQLLVRFVKYVREDRAVTPGVTRLARHTDMVDDYLRRTHDPASILRCEGGAT